MTNQAVLACRILVREVAEALVADDVGVFSRRGLNHSLIGSLIGETDREACSWRNQVGSLATGARPCRRDKD